MNKRSFLLLFAFLLLLPVTGGSAETSRADGMPVPFTEAAIRPLTDRIRPPGEGDDGQVRALLHRIAIFCSQPNRGAERRLFNRVMVEELARERPVPVVRFLLQELLFCADEQILPATAPLLVHPDLADPAAQVLLASTAPRAQVAAAVRAAMKTAPPKALPALVKAAGELEDPQAPALIAPHLDANDPALRLTAHHAVARIGAPVSRKRLEQALQTDNAYEHAQALANWQTYILARLREGDRDAAAELSRILLQKAAGKPAVTCSGLTLLTRAAGTDAIPELTSALESGGDAVRRTAARLLADLPAGSVRQTLIPGFEEQHAVVRSAILDVFRAQGSPAALPVVRAAVDAPEEPVKRAAIRALGELGSAAESDRLLQTAANDPALIPAVKAALRDLPREGLGESLLRSLNARPPTVRSLVFEILADRRIETAVPVLFTRAEDDADATARAAAVDALRRLAGTDAMPQALDLYEATGSGRERRAAEALVSDLCRRAPEPCESLLQKRFPETAGETRAFYLKLLSRDRTPRALQRVRQALDADAGTVHSTAVRLLSEWDDDALDDLFRLAQTSDDLKTRVLALRGLARLIRESDAPPGERADWARRALGLAPRAEERRAVVAALAGVPHVDALQLAQNALEKEGLKTQAIAAVGAIVRQTADRHPEETAEALQALREARGLTGKPVLHSGFETDSLDDTPWNDLSSIDKAILEKGKGAGDPPSRALSTDGIRGKGNAAVDLAVAGPARPLAIPIFAAVKFRLDRDRNVNPQGAVALGWTRADRPFNPYGGVGNQVSPKDHLVVGLRGGKGNAWQLAAVRGALGQLTHAFTESAAALTAGHWYRLEAESRYDAASKRVTFTVSLDDFGKTGEREARPDVLAGAVRLDAAGFGPDARLLLLANEHRGVRFLDGASVWTMEE